MVSVPRRLKEAHKFKDSLGNLTRLYSAVYNPSAHCAYVLLPLVNKKLTGWYLGRKLGGKAKLRTMRRKRVES